jgi:hypothetical protein
LLFALLLAGCQKPPEAKPPPNEALRMAFVYGAPGEKDFTRLVSIQTYGAAPSAGEHWTIVDAKGFVAEVVITGPEAGECDHCPTHRMLARVAERRDEPGASPVALGPATGPLRHARISRSNWSWHSNLTNDKFVFELEVDADGDGQPDLARWVRGPRVEYEIRARIGGSWVAREHWLTDDILDVMDKCPEPPEPPEPDSGCP